MDRRRKKQLKIFYIAMIVLLFIVQPGCENIGGKDDGIASPAVLITSDPEQSGELPVMLYNGVFNIELRVPSDWRILSLNQKNMTEKPEQSSAVEELDIVLYDDGGCGLELFEIWSRENSSEPEHVSLSAFVEAYQGISLTEYIDATAGAFGGEFDGYRSELEETATKVVAGREYGYLRYKTTTPEQSAVYCEEYYISEIDVSTFIVFCLTYWESNNVSYNAAQQAMTYITIGGLETVT